MKIPYKMRISLSKFDRVKLPNQWKQWCKEAKLRPHCRSGGRSRANRGGAYSEWLYLKGRGFVWRVDCNSMFERGDTHEEFDRWARCNSDEVPLPQTKEEFLKAVNILVNAYSDWKR